MLTCYIIDDEAHAIKSLAACVDKTPLLHILGQSQDALTAVAEFEEKKQYPDITFLDIDMPRISGLEVAEMLKGKSFIVFTTAHPHFAVEAFDMHAADYLLKPIAFHRFIKCVHKIDDLMAGKKQRENDGFFYIQSETKGKLTRIYFNDVVFIESQKNYISIVTVEKKHLTYLTLSEIETTLPRQFMRINKSFIVNADRITHVEGKEIFLERVHQNFVLGTVYKEKFSQYMNEHLIKTRRFGR